MNHLIIFRSVNVTRLVARWLHLVFVKVMVSDNDTSSKFLIQMNVLEVR